MTAPPLPASPCVRVKLDYNSAAGSDAGNRFYLSYSGSAPTGANCVTLAGDVATAWSTHIAPLISSSYALKEVDVLDIATVSGLSGQWTGSVNGADASTVIPGNVAVNVEFGIARRYRGGKPRIFWPAPGASAMQSQDDWTATFVGDMNTATAAFFSAIEGASIGAIGTLAHVNLSYYQGFTNHTSTSGRERAVPTYRSAALLDTITGYFTKSIIGSQRRRRTATTF